MRALVIVVCLPVAGRLLQVFRAEPLHFLRSITAEVVAPGLCFDRVEQREHARVVLHSLCALHVAGFCKRCFCLAILAQQILQSADGRLPEAWCLAAATAHHGLGKGYEAKYILFIYGLATYGLYGVNIVAIFPLCLIGIGSIGHRTGVNVLRFLRIVHKVLHKIGQQAAVGVALVYCLYACQVAIASYIPLQTGHITLLGVYFQSLIHASCAQQSPCIDVLHHVFIWAGGQLRAYLSPIVDVLFAAVKEHVGTHH